jgi:putative transposase
MDMFGWVIQVVLRPEQTKGFVVLKKRWVVERTFGWLNWSRRLSKDYERLPASSEAMIYISMIRLMVRRLA